MDATIFYIVTLNDLSITSLFIVGEASGVPRVEAATKLVLLLLSDPGVVDGSLFRDSSAVLSRDQIRRNALVPRAI